jgi:AAA domain-containing protein
MGFPECTPRPTLYCNMELQEEELKLRLDIVCKALGTTRAELKRRCDFLNLKGHSNGIDNALREIRMASRRQQSPWRLIIIDPIYKLHYGQDGENAENSNAAIGVLFEKLERVAREFNAALLLAHHHKKGSNADTQTIDLGSGAGTFARGPDALLALRSLEEENCRRCEPTIRYFKKLEPFGLRLAFPLLVPDLTLDVEKVAGREGAPKTYYVEDAIQYLASDGLTHKQWLDIVEYKLGCTAKTFRGLRLEALERHLIYLHGERNERDTKHFLTELGAETVEKSRRLGKLRTQLDLRNKKRKGKTLFSEIGGNGHS